MPDEPQSPLKPKPNTSTADPFDPASFGGQASSGDVTDDGFGNFDDFASISAAPPVESVAPEVNIIVDEEEMPEEKPQPRTPTPSPVPSPIPSPVPISLGAAAELAGSDSQLGEEKVEVVEKEAEAVAAARATPSPVPIMGTSPAKGMQEELLPGFGVDALVAVDAVAGEVCLCVSCPLFCGASSSVVVSRK